MSYALAGPRITQARVATPAVANLPVLRNLPAIADPSIMPECGSGSYCPQTEPMVFRDSVNRVPTNLALWPEALHVGVRGDPSLMAFLEEFTRRNLASWLTPSGMQTAAYDLGKGADVTIDPDLTSRAASALQNFNDIFQPDRWTVNPRGASQAGRDENGPRTYYFETWEEGPRPRPVIMNEALARIFSKNVGAFERDPWLDRVSALMRQVPRYTGPCCGDQTNIVAGGGPTWSWSDQPMPAASRFFWRVSNGKLQPTSWMLAMLDLLAPASSSSLRASALRTSVPKVPGLTRTMAAVTPGAPAPAAPEQPTSSHTGIIVVAALLVAGGGAAYWWSRRRK